VRRVIVSELLHRRSRTLALLAGILVATTAFSVLTATTRTARLQARGTVAENFRGSYDVLVRPRGSRSAIERRTGQTPPNFLAGIYGGISTAQWHRIERLPGVEVAAPIANVGYLLRTVAVPVDVSALTPPAHAGELLRGRITWVSDHGLTRVPDTPAYAYVTANRLRDEPSENARESKREQNTTAATRCARTSPGSAGPRPSATSCSSPTRPSQCSRGRSPTTTAPPSAASRP
jgi:putative ABC transport system permease protein